MKHFTTTALMIMVVFSATMVSVPLKADAACYYDDHGQYCTTGSISYNHRGGYDATAYRNYGQYRSEIARLEARMNQLRALLAQLEALENRGYVLGWNSSNYGDVDVTTRSAVDVSDDEATLRGEVDWNGEDEATVYFEYGRSSSDLDKETTHIVLDEDDDDEDFKTTIKNLRDDTRYYYRAVAEDEDGDAQYGRIYSFTTDDDDDRDDDEDYPEVELEGARNITDRSARLEGEVDMNDFRNGVVFFAYGEDEDQIDDIADDYDSYSDVDEDGDDLQKIKVDSDLDYKGDYYASMSGLDDDTDIFWTLCVEFEDEDDDDRLVCADTEDFRTDD